MKVKKEHYRSRIGNEYKPVVHDLCERWWSLPNAGEKVPVQSLVIHDDRLQSELRSLGPNPCFRIRPKHG